jgi:hypothetical protein
MEPLGKGRRLDDGGGSRKVEFKDLASCNGQLAACRGAGCLNFGWEFEVIVDQIWLLS